MTLWNDLEVSLESLAGTLDELEYKDVQDIPDSKLLDVLLEKYPHLVLIARAEGYGIADRLQMINDEGLRPMPVGHRLAGRYFEKERVSFWRESLLCVQKNRARAQTLRDAEALALIESANAEAIQAGERKLYLLITSSADVLECVKLAKIEAKRELKLTNERTTIIVRPTDMFLIYLKHASASTDKQVRASRMEIAKRLGEARTDCAPLIEAFSETKISLAECPRRNARGKNGITDLTCELAPNEDRIRETIQDAQRLREEYEDAQLILSANPDFEEFNTKIVEAESPNALERTVTHVIRRMLHDHRLRTTIKEHVDELRHELVRSVAGINAQVDAFTKRLTPHMVPYLLEAPFHLRFRSAGIQKELGQVLTNIGKFAEARDIRSMEEELAKLMRTTYSASLFAYERELVELVILLAFSRNGLAASLSNACLSLGTRELQSEFAYLNLRALKRCEGREDEVEVRCNAALRAYPNDPRFLFIAGFFAFERYEKTKKKKDLDRAIERTKQSLVHTRPAELLYRDELDNLAYFSCEAGDVSTALSAASNLKSLGMIPSRANWYETLGKVYLLASESKEYTFQQRQEFARMGVEALGSSLKGFLTRDERSRVVEACSRAEKQWPGLEP